VRPAGPMTIFPFNESRNMTVCFVAQVGPICVAAADTRISGALVGSLPALIWDSADMPVTASTGESVVVPYRFRKIRQIGRGWAVTAGSHKNGSRVLDMLCKAAAFGSDQAADILERAAANTTAEMASLSMTENDQSSVMGASVCADGRGVWYAKSDDIGRYAVFDNAQFAISWPRTIAPELGAAASETFKHSLANVNGMFGVVRSAVKLIGAARDAPDCSPVAQVGITWLADDGDYQTRYIADNVDELASATDDHIRQLWEVLPTLTPK
jgi:hypothetical protein